MNINSGMTVYKSVVPPVKSVKNEKEPVETVKTPRQDSVELSGKDKALSKDALEQIQNQQAASVNNMLSNMLGKQFASADIMNNAKAHLTKVGMGDITAEQAAKNISEDGPYGVDAVASNIMDMVTSLSGGDPDKFELLKDAVTEGFKAAGVELGVGDEISSLPQVSQDTFTEIMKRFDHYEENGSLSSYEYTPYEPKV